MGLAMSRQNSAAAVSMSPSQLLSVRARILEAAAEMFRTHGYNVPMDAVAAAANVAKQTLYNQFGSKEELFKEMVADRAAIMRAPLAAHALERHPRDMLTDVARQYYTHACAPHEIGYYRMIIGASQEFPEIGAAYYEAGPKQMLDALSQWIAREERLGRLDAGGDSQLAAEHFLGLITGQIEAKGLLGVGTEMQPAEIERRARYCADIFMRAFGPQRLLG
jgi:TetR/AcrR family transcriptional regulator, mexJK operon transcriptional repressor